MISDFQAQQNALEIKTGSSHKDSMKDAVLDKLIELGTISGYEYRNVDENGTPNKESTLRNTEQLIIEFKDGRSLSITTFCSGSAENTSLWFNLL